MTTAQSIIGEEMQAVMKYIDAFFGSSKQILARSISGKNMSVIRAWKGLYSVSIGSPKEGTVAVVIRDRIREGIISSKMFDSRSELFIADMNQHLEESGVI